jgi:hypothetical protein
MRLFNPGGAISGFNKPKPRKETLRSAKFYLKVKSTDGGGKIDFWFQLYKSH